MCPTNAETASPRDSKAGRQEFEHVSQRLTDSFRTSLPIDQEYLDLRPLGVGLNECERETLECCPVVLHEPTYAKLFALGISGFSLCVDSVSFLPGQRFEFARYLRDASRSRLALIIPARDECGDLVDLAALELESGRLALWRGRAAMLGQAKLFAPRMGEPLLVHETALDWLRAERQGVFVIDAQAAAPLLRLAAPIGVRREAFGRRLREALTIAAPKILVTATARRAA